MRTSDFDYSLPEKFIAQTPAKARDRSRLLVINCAARKISHHRFFEIEKFLQSGDLLVLNNTQVLPARLVGIKENGSAQIDVLLLKETTKNIWRCLVRPGKRLKKGARVIFARGKLVAEVLSKNNDGSQTLMFIAPAIDNKKDVSWWIEKLGSLPLPPYIKNTGLVKKNSYLGKRYQTVFANHPGAAAAPTAGLHFTPRLLDRLKKKGIKIAYVTLHTGLGTFRPVYVDHIRDHKMHSEEFAVSKECASAIKECWRDKKKGKGGRLVAVGTTVVRALETWAKNEFIDERVSGGRSRRIAGQNNFLPSSGKTDLFIYPGFRFRLVDALITNFHFPRSTLLMMVSALVNEKIRESDRENSHRPLRCAVVGGCEVSQKAEILAGRDLLLSAYEEAKRKKYRFFSFGDAMLIQ